MKYCAYQERAQSEVRKKLISLGCSQDDIENILCDLIDQNFINEERFARIYIRSKFNQKGWGKKKIELALKQKEISSFTLRNVWDEIDPNDYISKCRDIGIKKRDSIKGLNSFETKGKVAQFLISRGFENELVWEICNEIVPD